MGLATDCGRAGSHRSGAALPKVGPDSAQRQPSPPPSAVADATLIKDLLAQLSAAADPDDKKAIQALIDKITDRL
jgi:hypothetical protein